MTGVQKREKEKKTIFKEIIHKKFSKFDEEYKLTYPKVSKVKQKKHNFTKGTVYSNCLKLVRKRKS